MCISLQAVTASPDAALHGPPSPPPHARCSIADGGSGKNVGNRLLRRLSALCDDVDDTRTSARSLRAGAVTASPDTALHGPPSPPLTLDAAAAEVSVGTWGNTAVDSHGTRAEFRHIQPRRSVVGALDERPTRRSTTRHRPRTLCRGARAGVVCRLPASSAPRCAIVTGCKKSAFVGLDGRLASRSGFSRG